MAEKPKRIINSKGREVLKYPNGTEYDPETKHLVRGPDVTPITLDPVGMNKRGKLLRDRARIKGIIRGTGLQMPPEDDIDAMAMSEASAIEVLTAVMTNTFMNSQNLRGMAEAFNKLTGTKSDEEEAVTVSKDDLLYALAEFAAQIPVIEGKVIE